MKILIIIFMIFFIPISVEAQEVGEFNYLNLLGFLTFIVLLIGLAYYLFAPKSKSQKVKETTYILEEQIPKDPVHVKKETIISKKDVDHMFSMKKSDWEEFKFKYVLPEGWEARFVEHDTGSSIMAFDYNNNNGLSIQPLYPLYSYEDINSPPHILIVGSYYEKGKFNFDKYFLENTKKKVEKDLGSKYKVSVIFTPSLNDTYEVVEIILSN